MRGPKFNPDEGEHLLFAFLTMEPNRDMAVTPVARKVWLPTRVAPIIEVDRLCCYSLAIKWGQAFANPQHLIPLLLLRRPPNLA